MFKDLQNTLYTTDSRRVLCPVNLEMAVRAECLQVLICVVFSVPILMVSSEMVWVFVIALFTAQIAFSTDRDDKAADSIIAFSSEILIQCGATTRTKQHMSSVNSIAANLAWRIFTASARAKVLPVASRSLHGEHLAASFTWNLLSRFLAAAKKTLPIMHPRFGRATIGAKPGRFICPESSRKRPFTPFAAICFLAVPLPLEFEKAIFRAKARLRAIAGSHERAAAVFTLIPFGCFHFQLVYNVWPGR